MEYNSCPAEIKKHEKLIPKESKKIFDCCEWTDLFLAIVKDDPDIEFKPDEETGEYQEPCCFSEVGDITQAIWCLIDSVYRHTLNDIKDELKKSILNEIEDITEYDRNKLP